jgi:heme-degrading monooxygenase HmoA
MITVANRIYVAKEYADAFEQRFRERAGLVDQMPGFVSNQVLRRSMMVILMWSLQSGIAVRTFSTGCALMRL